MGKKLVLKAPKVPEAGIDVALIILGFVVIGFVIYGAMKNDTGRVIEASDRFGNKNNGVDAKTPSSGDKDK